MEGTRLKRAIDRLAHAVRHADPLLLAGAALLALAAGVHWIGGAAMHAQIAQLKEDTTAAARHGDAAGRERQRAEALSPAARLEEFYRFFPAQQTAPDWLQKIHEAAGKQGLQLPQADYRLLHDNGTHLVAYQVTYPMKGSYVQLRRFITQVLRDVPVASLDDVSLRRDNVGEAEVQATVKFTLHMKEAP